MSEEQPLAENPLIGPHEGCELDLMLAGKKKMAYFHDIVPPDGEIAEDIIPERAFAPHVMAGRIIRRCVESRTENGLLRQVCFALPGEEWRMDAVFFLRKDLEKNFRLYTQTDADDIFIGRLLGYKPSEIRAFLEHKRHRGGDGSS